MRAFFTLRVSAITLIASLLVGVSLSSNLSCSGGGNLKGGVNTKDGALAGANPQGPTTTPPQSPDEPLSVPGSISGSYLVCFDEYFNTNNDSESTVICSIRDNLTNNKVNLKTSFSSITWNAPTNTPLQVELEELPVFAKWHMRYRIKASAAADYASFKPALRFSMQTVDNGNTPGAFAPAPAATKMPSIVVGKIARTQADDVTGRTHCLDRYEYPLITQVSQVFSWDCNTISGAQDWRIAASGKLLHAMGQCLGFDADGHGKPVDCSGADVPTWEIFNSTHIREKTSQRCLTEAPFPNRTTGTYYGQIVLDTCVTTNPLQMWTISATST